MEEMIMAESMAGLKRTHRCTEVSNKNIGETVTVMGWVQKSRNKGGIIFVDLRDRSGILQLIFEESECGTESFQKAEKLRSEFVIAVTGKVNGRAGGVNDNLKTGDIEVRAESIRILSESDVPPFPIEEDSKTKEELRLKYRFLDLRRPDLQRNIIMKSQVATLTRQFLADEGFLEIEEELNELKNVKRPEVIKALKDARALGDLSENADYDAARAEQAQIEGRIVELEKIMENAHIIKKGSTDKVSLGTTVKIKYVDDDDIEEYRIVGSKEADPSNNKISNESPIAMAIMNAKAGEIRKGRLPFCHV